MVKAFFPEEEVVSLAEEKASHFARADFPDGSSIVLDACETGEDPGSRRETDRRWYRMLSKKAGKILSWGILLGVRPTKLAMQKRMEGWEAGAFLDWFQKEYLVSEEKAKLAWEIAGREAKILEKLDLENGYSLYIGIPFCPTVCSYCSFSSGALSDWQDRVDDYLDALCLELGFLADRSGDKKLDAVYIGGGTPTSLSASQLERLLSFVDERFDRSGLLEYTVEAGRPDTITDEKLQAIRSGGADRISINPQSMKKRTLELIGRSHSPEDIVKAFETAKSFGFKSINADIIAGLPEEDVTDFTDTLTQVMNLGADNITVHCLAVKRASRLIEEDPDFHYRQGETVGRMLAGSRRILTEAGFRPYYLYRQKHMAGAGENTGWCRPGTEGIYNMRIMDEHQSNIALGAGGISKIYYPAENRLERVANVTNYEQYIDRIDEMIKRKEDNIFTEVEKW